MNPLFPPSSKPPRRVPRQRTQTAAYGLYTVESPILQCTPQSPTPLLDPDPCIDPDLDLDTELSNLSYFIKLLLENRSNPKDRKTGIAILIGFCYSVSNIADILDSQGVPFDVGPLIRDLVYSSAVSGKRFENSDDPLL